MLSTLSVRHYALIDSLDISFPEGLIIITGQTGAGKSILLGALSLLMGAKADAGAIGGGAESCVVEGEFSLADTEEIRTILDENDVEWCDGTLLLRRVVHASGRSRSFINDSPVPLPVLQRLSSHLVDIHSQHQSLLLTDKRFQLSMLDFYASDASLLSAYRASYRALASLKASLDEAVRRLESLAAQKDYNESQYRQLEAAALKDGELEELEAEQRQLANAEQIKEDLFTIRESLSPSEDDRPSTESILRSSASLLDRVSKYVPQASQLSDRLSSLRIELDDILSEVETISDRIDVSSDRLQAVEARMGVLYDLLSKHSCRTVGELIEVRDRYSESLLDTSSLENTVNELRRSIEEESSRLDSAAAALRTARRNAAPSFAAAVTESLRFLEIEGAVFDVVLCETLPGPDGADEVTFIFSSAGQRPVEVAKCASGGEMSRIMLSLKALMARYTQMPTMIFDEIDSGVSGSVADRMGSMICRMGKDMQVFAITHLPQVAAKGDAHYLVTKSLDADGKAVSSISALGKEEREREVARMLSGSVITDAALANARSLLEEKV